MNACLPAPSQQRAEELCAATLRALTGDVALRRRGHQLQRGAQRLLLRAPHQRPSDGSGHFTAFDDLRAAADGLALRLRHSDAETNRRHLPANAVARLVFELLEQLRVESLVPQVLPGMSANLQLRFATWSRDFHDSGLAETEIGILLYAVAQMCWSRLNGKALPAEADDLIETTRAGIAAALGGPLAAMRRWRHDQRRFAPHAREIANLVGAAAGDDADDTRRRARETQVEKCRRRFALLLDFAADEGGAAAGAQDTAVPAAEDGAAAYRVFSGRFDAQIEPARLVRKALLREFRDRLDDRIARENINVARLARLLANGLCRPRHDGWRGGAEDGRIDGRRLAAVVASPGARDLFLHPQMRAESAAAVSFLIDCSGSMKARIETIAALVDTLARAADMAGAATEVLGFTTGAWNGGRVQAEWLGCGRPARPGRLNEICHMVFKRADAAWRRSREGIAALLKADLFREGVAGEAVDWGCERLLGWDAARRILVVVSDGCATDSATAIANGAGYLDEHLRDVVARREREGAIRIIGLGVGHDVAPFFGDSLTLDVDAPGSVGKTCLDLAALIGAPIATKPRHAA